MSTRIQLHGWSYLAELQRRLLSVLAVPHVTLLARCVLIGCAAEILRTSISLSNSACLSAKHHLILLVQESFGHLRVVGCNLVVCQQVASVGANVATVIGKQTKNKQ